MAYDDTEQVHLQQSSERHHSIIDWISHEALVVVRRWIESPFSKYYLL